MTRLLHISLFTLLFALMMPVLAYAQEEEDETPPPPSSAAQFQRKGVFGCDAGEFSTSVGARAATQSAYVPVNDAAVTINTYQLLYKECVLREVANREGENALAELQRSGGTTFVTGRNGRAFFPQDLNRDIVEEIDRVVLLQLQNGTLDSLPSAIREPVKRAIAQGYMSARNTPNKAFGCDYAGDLNALYRGRPTGSIWAALDAVGTPGCDPLIAYQLSREQIYGSASNAVNNMLTQLSWGEGCYPVDAVDANGNREVRTPGSIVCSNIQQLLQAGLRRLENSDDLYEMVNSLFSGITTHMLKDSGGLTGLVQRNGSQPSYLDRIVRESQQGLRTSAINAALQILATSKQIEANYKQIMENIARLLSDAISTLRARESACWVLVVDKVCAAAPNAQNECSAKTTCTTADGQQVCPQGPTLKVATTTAFSQAVISAQITPLASSTVTNIQNADKAIGLIDQLISGVTNAASLEAQRLALQQLDTLVAQRALHTQFDLQSAQGAFQDVTQRMGTVTQDTTTAWADSTDPNIGWCNVNNKSVVDMWVDKWKK